MDHYCPVYDQRKTPIIEEHDIFQLSIFYNSPIGSGGTGEITVELMVELMAFIRNSVKYSAMARIHLEQAGKFSLK